MLHTHAPPLHPAIAHSASGGGFALDLKGFICRVSRTDWPGHIEIQGDADLRTHALVHLINQQSANSEPALVLTQDALLAQALSCSPVSTVCCVPLEQKRTPRTGLNLFEGHSPDELGQLLQVLVPEESLGQYLETGQPYVRAVAGSLIAAGLPVTLHRIYSVLSVKSLAETLVMRASPGVYRTALQALCSGTLSEAAWAQRSRGLCRHLQDLITHPSIRAGLFSDCPTVSMEDGLTTSRLLLEVPSTGQHLRLVLLSLQLRLSRRLCQSKQGGPNPLTVLALDSSETTFEVLRPMLNEATATNTCLIHLGESPADTYQAFSAGARVHVRELAQGLPPFAVRGSCCVKVGEDCSFVSP